MLLLIYRFSAHGSFFLNSNVRAVRHICIVLKEICWKNILVASGRNSWIDTCLLEGGEPEQVRELRSRESSVSPGLPHKMFQPPRSLPACSDFHIPRRRWRPDSGLTALLSSEGQRVWPLGVTPDRTAALLCLLYATSQVFLSFFHFNL